jgi:6-phosphogluconolactonase (cycloisomerase 2 family)
MTFRKFGKALCMGALSAGIVFGISSCIESYAVGYLYITGTTTASSGNNGIITGYSIDHNTGKLTAIHGLPVSTGGANPVRAVLTLGSRYLYVLNRGVSGSGSANCYGVAANQCTNANIEEFAIGGNGSMTPQDTFFTQGVNPFRMIVDTTGSYILVLEHDAPDNANPSITDACARALGTATTTCGDITVFKVDPNTGRLSLVVNAQVTAASGQPLTYFPVPSNPVDFLLSGGTVLTLTGSTTPTSYPYTGGTSVWPYTYSSTSGQLTLSQNSAQSLGIHQGNAIRNASGVIYVLDNEPITIAANPNFPAGTYPSQILPFTVGTGGALQAEPSGTIPDDPTLANPSDILVESKGKFVYLANQGNNVTGPNPQSGIAGYFLTTAPAYQLSYIAGEPFGSGSGSQCIVEDPSNQFIFEANQYDSTVTGRLLDPNSGELNAMRVTSTYALQGPPTWCLMDGRTN